MTEGSSAKGTPDPFTDGELVQRLYDPPVRAWMDEHLPELRQSM